MSNRSRRRVLGLLLIASALGVGLASVAAHPVAAQTPCKPMPQCTTKQTPTPKPGHDTPKPTESAPASGQVQAIVAPTATPFDDVKATPGPIVGTLMTPQSAVAVPVNAQAITTHPQGETGLTALLVIAAALAVFSLAAVTVAIALR